MTLRASGGGLYVIVEARLDGDTREGEGRGMWSELAKRVDAAEYRPHLRDDIEVKTFKLRWGNDYAMIANPTDLVHYQLRPEDVELLALMDGTRTVKEIVVESFQESGDLALDGVVDLVRQLRIGNFLTEPYVDTTEIVRRAAHPTTKARTKAREFARTLSVDWAGAHKLVAWFYRYGLRFFFIPAVAVAALVFAVLGLAAFVSVYQSHRFDLGGDSPAAQTLILLGMDYILTFVHELGHAVVLVAQGRKIKSAGFMIYYGSPAFFVESSDSLMLDRGKRIVQSAAGPFAELVVSAFASIYLWAFPESPAAPFLFTWAVINYFVIFLNLIPLLELDGYFILADLIQVPDLRPRSLQFIRYDLWRKIRGRERVTKQEVGLAAYAIVGIAFTVFCLWTSIFFWRTIFGGLISQLWNGGVIGKALLVVLGLFIAGPILRGLITLARAAKKKVVSLLDKVRFRLQTRWRVEAAELLDRSAMFDDLPEDVLSDLAGRVNLRGYPAGKPVFRQGDRPDAFFIVRAGSLEVLEEDLETGKERVIRTLAPGDTFGELGLIDGAPRAATVRPITDSQLFEVDESTFDRLLSDMVHVPDFQPTLQQAAELRGLAPFASLGSTEIAMILDHGRWLNVAPGEVFVEQGQAGDAFYVIGTGQVEVIRDGQVVNSLGPGSHFGEVALLADVPRTATVIARTPTRVFRLDAEGFDQVVAGAFRRGSLAQAVIVGRTSQH
jgi:CRP-like cAMP-binding protein/Zn-dependent protease